MDLDLTTPGGVYLCQVDENISCGACCGLYNVYDAGFEYLSSILRERSRLFENTKRDIDSILEFAKIVTENENKNRPFSEFHHCPYIGFIAENRIGCLLHPWGKGNGGVDFRGLSYYGGFACRSYFCLTCRELEGEYKKIVRMAAENWHIYGLVITEHKMINCFFREVEETLGWKITSSLFEDSPAMEFVKEFMALKVKWNFRKENFKTFGNYFFEENEHPTADVDYSSANSHPSKYDEIFKALNSVFKDKEELIEAEKVIDDLAVKICTVLKKV